MAVLYDIDTRCGIHKNAGKPDQEEANHGKRWITWFELLLQVIVIDLD